MYPRHSRGWVLGVHREYQIPNLLRHVSSSNLRSDSGDQAPVRSKSSPVPADESVRLDDEVEDWAGFVSRLSL